MTATWATGAGVSPAAGGAATCAAIAAATARVIWSWIAASASAFIVPEKRKKNVWPGVGVGGGSSENEDDEQLWLEWNSTTTQRIVEFSKNLFENEEFGKTVAGVISTTTQRRDTNGKEKTTEKTTTGESLELS